MTSTFEPKDLDPGPHVPLISHCWLHFVVSLLFDHLPTRSRLYSTEKPIHDTKHEQRLYRVLLSGLKRECLQRITHSDLHHTQRKRLLGEEYLGVSLTNSPNSHQGVLQNG